MAEAATVQSITKLAQQLRVDSIRSTTQAGSGHPTSSMSAADLMAVLMSKYLKYDFKKPEHPNNDRLIFSKGHAAPLLYSLYKAAGAIDDKELLTLRKMGSRLEGHPVPEILPWVDVATGSLGQGLAMGVGMALSGKFLDKLPFRVWVLLGDSEMAEGSVWEAMACASHYKLDNMTAILDMNRLGQRGETMLGWHSDVYAERGRAFGWNVIEIDGHNLDKIDAAYKDAIAFSGQPTLIIAKTEKGHGIPLTANKDGWHGKPLSPEQAKEAVELLGGAQDTVYDVQKPEDKHPANEGRAVKDFVIPKYDAAVATREAYGDALKALGASDDKVVVVDAEVSNSTYADKFGHSFLERFFEMYIAEQCMLGVAIGLANRGKICFASTFAAFLSRGYDFIRMGAICRSNMRLCGSHAGVSIGQDGPSQMALEDLSMMRAIHGSTVLYPSDGVSTAHLVKTMSETKGISYMRTTREKTPILYKNDDTFPIGGSKTLHSSDKDKATIVACGITLHESMKAYEELKKEGINVRIIDAYSVKPIDKEALAKAAKETGTLIVVEDHWPEGGLGDAVLDAFASCEKTLNSAGTLPKIVKLAVKGMAGSGTPQELMDEAGISAKHVVAAVKGLK
ncbi:MAG: transketolase [Leptolyngbya sp.]|nr:transketolase [Candidatus Melainabacteria bacterium]